LLFVVYALGSHTLQGGRLRVSSQVDTTRATKTVLRADTPNERLQVMAQVVDGPSASGRQLGAAAAATLRGADYTAALRLTRVPELGCSYHQRLSPGSPVTLGGEWLMHVPALRTALRGERPAEKPLEWAVGGAYDAREHKVRGCGSHVVVRLLLDSLYFPRSCRT
jgi:hypothetical protein